MTKKTTRKRSPDVPGLRALRGLAWSEIVDAWERQEARQPGWIRYFRGKGFTTWRAWRMHAMRSFRPATRAWTLYRVENPTRTIPAWWGGPFRGWRSQYYRGKSTMRFADLARLRALQRHGKIRSVQRHFPKRTRMFGVLLHGRVFVLDGMHRCVAVALSAREQKTVSSTVDIALAVVRKPLSVRK